MNQNSRTTALNLPHARGGFTLIEMVVALALLGLMAASLFQGLRFGQRAYEKVIEQRGASWQVFAGQRLIRALIESAYPQQPALTATIPAYGIEGGKERVLVTAAAPLATGGAGLYRYEIDVRRNASGQSDLVMRWQADFARRSAADSASGFAEETLIEGVTSVEWSYLPVAAQGSDPIDAQWRNEWRGSESLPRLVRLRVRFPASDRRSWPDLIVAPRITDDANCSFDAVAQRCRRTA